MSAQKGSGGLTQTIKIDWRGAARARVREYLERNGRTTALRAFGRMERALKIETLEEGVALARGLSEFAAESGELAKLHGNAHRSFGRVRTILHSRLSGEKSMIVHSERAGVLEEIDK